MPEIAASVYLIIRVLVTVTFVVAFIQKTLNYNIVLANWTRDDIPLLPYSLWFALAVELVGSIMIILDYYTWAVAIGWFLFTILVFRWTVTWGRTERGISPLAIQVAAKNISLIGAYLALIIFDKTRPDWLTQLLFK